jgi:hypothetical protein
MRIMSPSLLLTLTLLVYSCTHVMTQDVQATCKVDDDGNCIDTTCDNKYPDCEKWASEGSYFCLWVASYMYMRGYFVLLMI